MVQGNESDEGKVDKGVMDCITARRKTQPKTQEPRQQEGGQEESTDGSDLRQDGWVVDVPADGITKRQS